MKPQQENKAVSQAIMDIISKPDAPNNVQISDFEGILFNISYTQTIQQGRVILISVESAFLPGYLKHINVNNLVSYLQGDFAQYIQYIDSTSSLNFKIQIPSLSKVPSDEQMHLFYSVSKRVSIFAHLIFKFPFTLAQAQFELSTVRVRIVNGVSYLSFRKNVVIDQLLKALVGLSLVNKTRATFNLDKDELVCSGPGEFYELITYVNQRAQAEEIWIQNEIRQSTTKLLKQFE
ncbi:Arp2/3_complex subunit 2/4 [Hexamita inflata]|uniref:Arp2/3 complex subunit 2/4 n=1 Tax=Hexamita inflata TaxID=28002 RepID=A0AA86RN49_9EUKA|nr:Arp2/3 complex subunit 2/4 [Hexamita inflata]